jgi:uncharacterized OB-fold protein
MSEPLPTRPAPIPDADSRHFWEGVENHELRIQKCRACDRHIYYPRSLCPYCHGADLEWVRASGSGILYSYTVSRRPAGPGFAADVPYVVALVDLAEGPRMMSNLVDVAPEDVTIGQRVEVDFREMSPGLTLPVFRPA